MHKLKVIIGIFICFLFLCNIMIGVKVEPVKAAGNTIWVDDDFRYPAASDGTQEKPYTTIQAAIDAAVDGDTVVVLPGLYGGDLVIDKSIKLTSVDVPTTIIASGSSSSYNIDITSDSVSLEGFNITDVSTTSYRKAVIHIASDTSDVVVTDNYINETYDGVGIHLDGTYKAVIGDNIINNPNSIGVYIQNSDANVIYGNMIENNSGSGAIYLTSSDSNIIEKNVIKNSTHGIYAQSSIGTIIRSNKICKCDNSGIKISLGSGNIVENNTIFKNSNTGIYFSSAQSYIIDNEIYDNGIGIGVEASESIIRNNSISHCNNYGVYAGSGSNNNLFYNNTFHDLIQGANHATEKGDNQWDNGGIGNYWSDFYGPDPNFDSNLDTLVDTDFYYKTGGVVDHYPTGIFQQPPVITDPTPAHLDTGVSLTPSLSVKIKDPDNSRMEVSFYYIINNISKLIDVVSNVMNTVEIGSTTSLPVYTPGTASIPFFSPDKHNVYSYIGHGYDYICVWYVIAKDQYSINTSDVWIFTTRNIPIDNEEPIADTGGPYIGEIGDEIQFDGSGCYDPDADGQIVFYRWSFGDGISVTNVNSPTHIYQNAGDYDVSLITIDDDGSSSVDTINVTIKTPVNDPPMANANGPYSGKVGELITFNSFGSYDPDFDDISYSWDLDGDGIVDSIEQTPTHTYTKAGNYTIILTVTDNEGLNDINITYTTIKSIKKESPGFEVILIIAAIFIVFNLKQKRKKHQ